MRIDGAWWHEKVEVKPTVGVCQSCSSSSGGTFPCVTPVGNGASDPLAWCQGKVTESSGSGWGLFVKVCSLLTVNFLSIIFSHNVYKTSTLI